MAETEDKNTSLSKQDAAAPVPSSSEPQPLIVSARYVQETKQSLALLQQLVRDVLVDGRDYGHVDGIPGKFLWDPGASQVIGSFNSFPGKRRILSLVDDGKKIAVIMEVPVIHRGSLQEVGSGIGASSTMEVKHKYRWVTRPDEWGYEGDAAKKFKTRQKEGRKVEYQIPNPEHDELLNVIVKQASKRAEVDAAEALPGVSSVLRELFNKTTGAAGDETGPPWQKFWSAIRAMFPEGAAYRAETHKLLGVNAMRDWLSSGRSLNDALKMVALKRGVKPAAAAARRDPTTITETEVDGGRALQQVMFDCFGWQPIRVWSEANYANLRNFEEAGLETAWQVFQRLVPVANELSNTPQEE